MSIKNLKTFLMEDDPVFQNIVENELRKKGVSDIQVFDNANKFMDAIKQGPDFVVLDFSLQDLNGLDVLKYVKKHRRRAYVVMFSTLKDPQVIEQCLKNGAKDFLDKGDESSFDKMDQHLKNASKRKSMFRMVIGVLIIAIIAVILLLTMNP